VNKVNLAKPHKDITTKEDSGFTLVEVLIAMGIFAIGFLLVGSMQINAQAKTNSARRTTEALAVAEDRVEQLRSLPFYLDNSYNVSSELNSTENPHIDDVAGPFTACWIVSNDVPIDHYDAGVITVGTLTRSKTIRVWVTPDNNSNDIQADIVFAKFMFQDQS
jgi:type IV pilus modification protein PilV